MGSVYALDSGVVQALVRSENSRYTLFLRHDVGHAHPPDRGFPVENQGLNGPVLRKTRLMKGLGAALPQPKLLYAYQIDQHQDINDGQTDLHPGQMPGDLVDLPRQERGCQTDR